MEKDLKRKAAWHTAGVIIEGMMKLLWYLFLIAVGVAVFLVSLCLEASKPNKNNYC
jgi:hypothetical protein